MPLLAEEIMTDNVRPFSFVPAQRFKAPDPYDHILRDF